MGLFSFGKKKQADGFEFLMDTAYALKEENSAVITGKMTRGKLTPQTPAIFLDEQGEPLFSCRVVGIEQGTQLVKAASWDAKGTYGPHYGLKLLGVTKEQLPSEGTLVSETEELLERLQERRAAAAEEAPAASFAPAEAAAAETAAEEPKEVLPEGPLGGEREEELRELLKSFTEENLKPLTIQECIFMLCTLQKLEREAEDYQTRGQMLYLTILDKLKEAPSLYLILDEGSSLPLIVGDTVDVFSEKEMAEKAVEFYSGEFHRRLFVKEIVKGKTGLPGKCSLFAWLYYLGMERLLIDNGSYQLVVKRSDLLADPLSERRRLQEVPVVNPGLRYTMADYLQELRWNVTYSDRETNLAQKKAAAWQELFKAHLLVPMKYDGRGLSRGQNTISQEQTRDIRFPRVENSDGKLFLPMFTDWPEFQRAYKKEEWGCMVFSLADAIRAAGDDYLVINPLTENLILDQDAIRELKEVLKSRRPKIVK